MYGSNQIFITRSSRLFAGDSIGGLFGFTVHFRLTDYFKFLDSQGIGYQITSSWRSKDINQAVGGAEYSKHLTGSAVDFVLVDKNIVIPPNFEGLSVQNHSTHWHVEAKQPLQKNLVVYWWYAIFLIPAYFLLKKFL